MAARPVPDATTAFAVRYIRHRPDRFWVQTVCTRDNHAVPAFPSAVQDPEYFIGWREFFASHADAATPRELQRSFADIYDAGLWEPWS